jgi:hypothetical protein
VGEGPSLLLLTANGSCSSQAVPLSWGSQKSGKATRRNNMEYK